MKMVIITAVTVIRHFRGHRYKEKDLRLCPPLYESLFSRYAMEKGPRELEDSIRGENQSSQSIICGPVAQVSCRLAVDFIDVNNFI